MFSVLCLFSVLRRSLLMMSTTIFYSLMRHLLSRQGDMMSDDSGAWRMVLAFCGAESSTRDGHLLEGFADVASRRGFAMLVGRALMNTVRCVSKGRHGHSWHTLLFF